MSEPALRAWLDRRDSPLIVAKQDGGFGPHVKSIMKAVHQEMSWNARDRTWQFPYWPASVCALTEAAQLLGLRLLLDSALEQIRSAVVHENEREQAVRKLMQRYMDDPKLPLAPFTTQETPPPYRHQALAWHWGQRVKALYLQHKMGLGKTREGADIIRGLWERGVIREPQQVWIDECPSVVDPERMLPAQWCTIGGILVVAPRASMLEWREQLWRWQGIQAIAISSRSAEYKRQLAGTPAWVHVCSYDSLEVVERNYYDAVIGDELHYIANEDSNRFQRMLYIRRRAQFALGLSGTAESNGPISLWSQYFWLDGGRSLGPTLDSFRRNYMSREAREKSGLTTAEMVSRAIARITWPLSMQEAFPDKPQKIHKTVRVEMTDEQARYYEKVRSSQEADILTGRVTVMEALNRLLKLQQIAQGFVFDDKRIVQQFSSAKLKALEDMLKPGGDLAGRRLIVWCSFIPEVGMVEAVLKRLGLPYMALHGGLSESQKETLKWEWNNNAKWRVLIGMIQMGIGLNLHAPKCVDDEGKPARCSTTVFYGFDWRVTRLEQAMDRVYRSDQVESCLYIYLLSEDLDSADGKSQKPVVPIDVRIYERLIDKIDNAKELNENSIEYVRSLLAPG